MLKRLWSINEKDIEKQSVFWNIVSSSINSIVFYVPFIDCNKSLWNSRSGGFFHLAFQHHR